MPDEESDADLGIARVQWDSDDPHQSLLNLYAHDTDFARVKVRWYLKDAAKNGQYARRIRLAAIALATAGVLTPLIDAALPPNTVHMGPWGYVVIALSAGLFSIDRFAGFSWSWTRSTIIWVALRRELAEFQHDWNMLMSRADAAVEHRLARLKAFRQNVEAIIAQECKDWADMTINARLELEQALQRDLKPR
jgi:hypothetical protein